MAAQYERQHVDAGQAGSRRSQPRASQYIPTTAQRGRSMVVPDPTPTLATTAAQPSLEPGHSWPGFLVSSRRIALGDPEHLAHEPRGGDPHVAADPH